MPDRVSSSRLELRLEGEIAGAPTALEADCKHAELAAYRTRLGRVEEAKSTLGALHRRYDSSPHVAISAWLNLVEGLVAHFGDMDPSARDKVMRSHALSTAAGLTPMRALSAAWLAHLDYLHVDVSSMTRHVAEALQLSDGNHHGARSRTHLVVAQAHHLAGYLDRALPWYSRAREHALADGDDATVSALMHNMAWLRAHALRQRAFLAMGPGDVTMHALMGAESTGNFDFLIGSESLQSLVPVLRAQVLAATGREAEALDIYEAHLIPALKEGMRRLQADLLADVAWCRLKVGQVDRALEDALLAEASINPVGQFDDRALAHSRLAQIFDLLGSAEAAAMHKSMAAETWAGHAVLQGRIVEALSGVGAMSPSPTSDWK